MLLWGARNSGHSRECARGIVADLLVAARDYLGEVYQLRDAGGQQGGRWNSRFDVAGLSRSKRSDQAGVPPDPCRIGSIRRVAALRRRNDHSIDYGAERN